MPIYEYEPMNPKSGCKNCTPKLEYIQSINDQPLKTCPSCNQPLKRIISRCHAAVVEHSAEDVRVTDEVKNYEKEGMWSHAAELADKHSEKTGDSNLKLRAYDNYHKAGYDVDSLSKGSKSD